MEKPLLLLDNTWLESKSGRHFVVIGRWFGKDKEEIELLEYLGKKSFRWPASHLKQLINDGFLKTLN